MKGLHAALFFKHHASELVISAGILFEEDVKEDCEGMGQEDKNKLLQKAKNTGHVWYIRIVKREMELDMEFFSWLVWYIRIAFLKESDSIKIDGIQFHCRDHGIHQLNMELAYVSLKK